MKPPLVRVEWDDAWSDHDETGAKDWADHTPVVTVGYLVRSTRRVVSVASEVVSEGRYRCVTHIPRSIVRRVVRVR